MKTAFRRTLRMSAAALLATVFVTSAEAQMITYKHWFGTGTPAPLFVPEPPVFVLPAGSPTIPTGFPGNVLSNTGAAGNTFTKLYDQTALRCQFAGDFDALGDTTIIEQINIDGGKWAYAKGHFVQANTWTADFWSVTMIGATPNDQIPAGVHTVDFLMGAGPAVEAHFYPQAAVLSCFEEFLGIAQ